MADTPTPDNVLPGGGDNMMDLRAVWMQELVNALQAAEALRENKTHTIRTRDLDIEKEQSARIINAYLSKNAYDALHAMEFMHMIMPQMVGNVAAIFAQHQMTYMPLVDTLNGIAKMRMQAKQQKEAQDGKEEHGSKED